MEVYAAQIDRMDQGIGRIARHAREAAASSTTRWSIFLADNGACAEDIPRGRDDRRAGRQAHDRAPHDAQRRAGALRQRPVTHARAGEHLPELRHGVGQPLEHAVPPLQALDPRGRHRDAADRALAERHRATRRARCATRRATCPTSWRRSSTSPARRIRQSFDGHAVEPLEGQSLLPVFAGRDGDDRQAHVLGARGQRRGAHRPVEARASAIPRAWELYDMDADRTELHDLAAQQPERVADMARAVRRLGEALRRARRARRSSR